MLWLLASDTASIPARSRPSTAWGKVMNRMVKGVIRWRERRRQRALEVGDGEVGPGEQRRNRPKRGGPVAAPLHDAVYSTSEDDVAGHSYCKSRFQHPLRQLSGRLLDDVLEGIAPLDHEALDEARAREVVRRRAKWVMAIEPQCPHLRFELRSLDHRQASGPRQKELGARL
jgi:hypothetical protein